MTHRLDGLDAAALSSLEFEPSRVHGADNGFRDCPPRAGISEAAAF